MATKIVMEALSPTMEEGRLVEWKKNEGDAVQTGDVLAEVETDKAVMELVARTEGTLLKQLVAAGTTVPVSAPVGIIGKPGEDVGAAGVPKAAPAAAPMKAGSTVTSPGNGANTPPAAVASPPAGPPVPLSDRVKASPLARKIAADRGVDLAAIQGSGPEGRIVRRDLETLSGKRSAVSTSTAPGRGPLTALRLPLTPFTDVPLSQIRKTIAKRLGQSLGPIPTFYLTMEVDMERAWDTREALKELGEEGKISFNDIIVKATALALRQHPACNAWWQDDHIRYWNEIHVGMAVAVEDGLITPVIRHADQKILREISTESKDLAARARERKLKPQEYTGSTFSVSNLGMFDIDEFTAIINPPEAGILAVGRIAPRTEQAGDRFVARRKMRLTMSCDHRVIDGATGAQFLKTLKTMLENPLAMVW